MTTTDTMDTIATMEQSIRCIEAGAELVRITALQKRSGRFTQHKNELRKGLYTPLDRRHSLYVLREIAARIVEKVRWIRAITLIRKKFEQLEYTDGNMPKKLSG